MNKIIIFMKRNYKIILLILILAAAFFGFRQQQIAKDKESAIINGVQRIIDYAHYQPKTLNNNFSKKVFEQFIEDIDPSKRYLLQADIDSLSKYKNDIDDEILTARLDFYQKTYELIQTRQKEVLKFIDEILDKGFDFSKDESLNIDYKKIKPAKDKQELKERWRKYLKFNTLSRLYEKTKEEEKKAKKDSTYVAKTKKELEKEALNATRKSIRSYTDMLDEMEESEYFAMYMNAITMQNDPHTNYFSPQGKERFDTSMSGSFEGIGARLQKEGDYVKIIEIIAGGPAWKDGQLKVGDLIQKVAQGDDEPVDIMGMRLSKVVKLIKGPKGTVVKLIVKRVDGNIETIPITRDRVELEETFAKSLLVKDNGQSFGYIYLPKFYINFNERTQRSAASDIKKELKKLIDENVNGIVLDLRNNGGGSLSTVIDIAGYFIKKGPVVQVRDKKGDVDVLKDTDADVLYKGKVVVLINELSASASEILAAALQDYNRAIIIGGKSYGKGTVQNLIELTRVEGDRFGDLGALKWTTKKFYRINGGSTQRKGVTPDIIIPDTYMYLDVREENEPTALDWDQINKASYKTFDIPGKKQLIQEEQKRIYQTQLFNHIKEKAKWLAENKKDNTIYLKWEDYIKDIQKTENISKKFDSLTRFESKLQILSLPQDLLTKQNDTVFQTKREKWIKNLKKDPYVFEAVKILEKMTSK
jgi:carboxyl-terminal processing protease